jgi:SAM-dependent methyltransferase
LLPRGSTLLLDAGAGSGLIDGRLAIMGYPHVEALDISEGMLARAAKKRVYAALHHVAFGGPLPFTEAHFAGIVSAGVFTSGYVGVEGLDELNPVCRRGGAIVPIVKNTLWDQGFAARVGELEANVVIARAEEAPPYISMPGEAGTVPSRGLVPRKL